MNFGTALKICYLSSVTDNLLIQFCIANSSASGLVILIRFFCILNHVVFVISHKIERCWDFFIATYTFTLT